MTLTSYKQALKPIVACLLLVFYVIFSTTISARSFDNSQFKISPRSCLALEQQDYCNTELLISWKLKSQVDFCVYFQNGIQLFCEYSKAAGSKKIDGNLTQTSTFVFKNLEQQQLAEITVYLVKKSSAKKRKRYNHPWSIF